MKTIAMLAALAHLVSACGPAPTEYKSVSMVAKHFNGSWKLADPAAVPGAGAPPCITELHIALDFDPQSTTEFPTGTITWCGKAYAANINNITPDPPPEAPGGKPAYAINALPLDPPTPDHSPIVWMFCASQDESGLSHLDFMPIGPQTTWITYVRTR